MATRHPHRVSAFNWPPSEKELDDIQVLDIQAMTTTGAPAAVAAAPTVPAAPSAQKVPAMAAAPGDRHVFHPRELRRAVPRFASSKRWMAVATPALVGLTLTTLLEFRIAPARQPIAEHHGPARIEAAVLQARRHRLGPSELVPALHVRPRIVTARISAALDLNMPKPAEAFRSAARSPSASSREIVTGLTSPRLADVANASALPGATHGPVALAITAVPGLDASTQASGATITSLPSTMSAHHVEAAERTNARVLSALPEAVDAPEAERTREDERGIYRVLHQYQHAYARLDVNAARAVWPSLNTRALARAFGGLKEQSLEFSACQLAMETRQATAICGGRATYVPRVGPQSARTEPRQWTFRLQKVDADWQIARAEVK